MVDTISKFSELVIGAVGYFFLSRFLDIVEAIHNYSTPSPRLA